MTPESKQMLQRDVASRAAPPYRSIRRDALVPRPHDIPTREVLQVPLALTDYAQAMDVMDGMIERRDPGYFVAAAVHVVAVAQHDPETLAALRGASLVLPDGMPLVWAINKLGDHLENRVYGPELMRRYSDRCAEVGHRVWLYGGRDQAWLAHLALNMRRRHRGIQIVGGFAPPFRPLAANEEDDLVERINRDRPDVLWVGTGAPKQEKWMARMRDRLEVPVMCGTGAAFDFNSGRIAQAPPWMQERGLEWAHRVVQEPRRLMPRYMVYNPRFLMSFRRQLVRERRAARGA